MFLIPPGGFKIKNQPLPERIVALRNRKPIFRPCAKYHGKRSIAPKTGVSLRNFPAFSHFETLFSPPLGRPERAPPSCLTRLFHASGPARRLLHCLPPKSKFPAAGDPQEHYLRTKARGMKAGLKSVRVL